jgi:5-methyltetrahydropteroyltriglutamate--homocysteine methyltransferase
MVHVRGSRKRARSLPRPATLSDLLISQEAGETIDAAALARELESATAHVINEQVAADVDVGNDGEQSRVGFQTYVSGERVPLVR